MLRLIDNWREAPRFSSMQLNAFAVLCDLVLAAVVIIDQRFPFDPLWYVLARLALTAAGMGARLIAQQVKA
ncbi:hypothetical protein D3C73_1234550 [compost metagenome]